MASSSFSKNGNESRPPAGAEDIKILVVGEQGCGKTTFIRAFYEPNKSNGTSEADNSIIYPIKYEMSKTTYNIHIYEFNGFKGEDPLEALEQHTDVRGFVLMYAIDDPLSFERVTDKWYANLDGCGILNKEEKAILVGNKRDLRDNPQVIQRLTRVDQVPVTVEQGENLVKVKAKIGKYFDCSSAQNQNVNEAFEQILAWGLNDLISNPGVWL